MILISLAVILLSIASALSKPQEGKLTKFTALNNLVIDEYTSAFHYITQTPYEKLQITVTNKLETTKHFFLLFPEVQEIIGIEAHPELELEATNQIGDIPDALNSEVLRFRSYKIFLKRPLEQGETKTYSGIKIFYKAFAEFVPKEVNLFESQKVRVRPIRYPATFYQAYKITFKHVLGDRWVTTNPWLRPDLPPLSPESEVLVFDLNAHHTNSMHTTRYVEISHWGNVWVHEVHKLQNRAATFNGPYSTLDFNPGNKHVGRHCFRDYTVALPPDAWGLYYRDEVGNISTTEVTKSVSLLV